MLVVLKLFLRELSPTAREQNLASMTEVQSSSGRCAWAACASPTPDRTGALRQPTALAPALSVWYLLRGFQNQIQPFLFMDSHTEQMPLFRGRFLSSLMWLVMNFWAVVFDVAWRFAHLFEICSDWRAQLLLKKGKLCGLLQILH